VLYFIVASTRIVCTMNQQNYLDYAIVNMHHANTMDHQKRKLLRINRTITPLSFLPYFKHLADPSQPQYIPPTTHIELSKHPSLRMAPTKVIQAYH
jgi:hypothetical protein